MSDDYSDDDPAVVLWHGAQWQVTEAGIDCIDSVHSYYFIRAEDVHGLDWVEHMKTKGWVSIPDFRQALEFARKTFPNEGGGAS